MKNSNKIKKQNLIDKVVKKSVDNFMNSLKASKAVSPCIDGSLPNISKYIKTFNNVDFNSEENFEINEGLIKTYPIDKTKNFIIKKYGLSGDQIQISQMNNGILSVDVIGIILPNSVSKNIIGNIKHDLRTCGYFINQAPIAISNTNFFIMVFEPKFSQEISDIIKRKYQYLYHQTPQIYIKKIIKNGLIPKSNNALFFYPDRTFLMVGDKLNPKQIDALKNIQKERNTHINVKNPLEKKEYSIITIETSKLPSDIMFYCDPLAHGAIFTYDNIPPNAIINIESFKL